MPSVWYIVKPGDERRYATPTLPSLEWAWVLRRQGFEILRLDFELPAYLDIAVPLPTGVKFARVASDEERAPLPDVPGGHDCPRCGQWEYDDTQRLCMECRKEDEPDDGRTLVDPLHPTGRCTCAGDGSCSWCTSAEKREIDESVVDLFGKR